MASQETKAGMEERKTGGAPPTSGESTAEVNMCVCVEGLGIHFTVTSSCFFHAVKRS